jgi:S1-C subfamily serine protease
MKRAGLYSSSRRGRPQLAAPQPAAVPIKKIPLKDRARRLAWPAFGILLLVISLMGWMQPRGVRQETVDESIALAVERLPRPFSAGDAYEKIAPSVVFVRGLTDDTEDTDGKPPPSATGSGVVIVDDGTILTNLHVVQGARRIRVTFADGLEAEAVVAGVRAEHDLAVLKPEKIPDDLVPATLRSTADLRIGDEVVAVGFPFGIGPSASSGVVSGLKREYRASSGARLLTNLIQFDAAANPGNSGGPLVTADGEVVGIVTGLLNPTEQRVFIGIGFAVPIENAAQAAGLSPF